MSKPYIHALSSAKKFGGTPEDYIEIHSFMDSSKGAMADNRHRALTHNAWFLVTVLERVRFANSYVANINQLTFPTITNSDGKRVSVRDVGEQHILEDFKGKFIPTAQDYLAEMEFHGWMQNGRGLPPSFEKLAPQKAPVVAPQDAVFDGCRPVVLPPPIAPNDDQWPFPGVTIKD